MTPSTATATAELADLSVLAHQLLNLMTTAVHVLREVDLGHMSPATPQDRQLIAAARQGAADVVLALCDLARGSIAAAGLAAFAGRESDHPSSAAQRNVVSTATTR